MTRYAGILRGCPRPSFVLLNERQCCCRKLPEKIILLSKPLLHLGVSLAAHSEWRAPFFATYLLCNPGHATLVNRFERLP